MQKQRFFLIYLCFFLSGAAGLIYEVVWARQLSLFLGITFYAHTAVIAAYMLGLAAGSWWIGKRADLLAKPLRFYAWVEIGIGLFAVVTPWLFDFLQTMYARWAGIVGVVGTSAHLTRFAIALALLLLPTFLMGGTLPLLVRGVVARLPQLGAATGRLYGINTLGATAGVAAAGFVLLPRFGVFNAILFGVLINLGIGVLILLLKPDGRQRQAANRHDATAAELPIQSPTLSTDQRWLLLAGFAAAGFAALLTQLAWIRSMVLVVGGSVYAFTITLTAFLAGIGLGSLVYSHFLNRPRSAESRFVMATSLAFLIAMATLLSLLVITHLPAWFLQGYAAGWVENFALYQLFMFVLCFAVMFLPTALMGALFPLLAVTWTSSLKGAGKGIGGAYAVNTLGSVFGTLLGGLVLLRWLGIHRGLVLAAAIYVLIGIGFWFAASRRRPLALVAALATFLIAAWLLPPWDKALMGKGVYYRPATYLQGMQSKNLHDIANEMELLYYKEGMDGTVAVGHNGFEKSLYINGKADASSKHDLATQVGLGQIGTLMHPDPRRALVIGLGSGITASSAATHENIEELTVLEISPEVIEASAFFAEENRAVLKDPRVNLVAADARNYVLASQQQWDLIISEPSNPWISGVSNLFTRDFFHLTRQKLAPGGIMTQWFHTYSLSVADVKSVIHAFKGAYPHVSIWTVGSGDLILIGSEQPHALSFKRLQSAFTETRIGPDLQRAGFASPRDLLGAFVIADGDVRGYAAGAELNTDRYPRIEFNAPRSMYSGGGNSLADMVGFLDGRRQALPVVDQVTRTESGMSAHSMRLLVESQPQDDLDEVRADWFVSRKFYYVGERKVIFVTDQRELSWREGTTEIKVEVLQLDKAPTPEQRDQTLIKTLIAPVLQSGNLNRESDPYAMWVLGGGPGKDVMEIAMLWTCPLPSGGVNRFLLVGHQADPGQERREDHIHELAARFTCL